MSSTVLSSTTSSSTTSSSTVVPRPQYLSRGSAPTHPLLRQFDAEWHDLRFRYDGIVDEWSLRTPAFDGFHHLNELVNEVQAGNDVVTLALLHLANDAEPLAGRCVLQALLPELPTLAARNRASVDDVVSHTWLAIYETARVASQASAIGSTPGVVPTILSRTRRLLRRERCRLWLVESPDALPASESHESGLDADQVVAIARRLRLLTNPTLNTLSAVYGEGLTMREVAVREGVSYESVRQRTTTALQVLRTHAQAIRESLDDADPSTPQWWEGVVCA